MLLKNLEENICEIDNFLLSCRALGRKVENDHNLLFIRFLKKNNFKKVIGKYSPSKKNIQVKDFYGNMGFQKSKIKNEWYFNLSKYISAKKK